MIHSIKRLWSDRRGNVLAIVGAAIPLVVGSAGLATDTIQWVTWKRELQRATDSAAFAGVLAKAQGAANANSAVATDWAKHNNTGISLVSGYPQIAYPTSPDYTGAVRVTLAIQKRLGFSSLFVSQAPIIVTSATAALIDDGEYCLRSLKQTSDPGIKLAGGASATLGCKAHSNSTSATDSVHAESASYTFSTTGVSGVGGLPSTITGTPTSALRPFNVPQPDPFKDLYPTDVPSSVPCGSMNDNKDTAASTPSVTVLKPGCYTGNNQFKFNNGTTQLSPGVYYLDSIDFDVQGGTVTGTGVTIILTGSDPGTLKFNASGNIQLTAPTTGTYAKMLLIQASNADPDNSNTVNGSASSYFDGAMYFPKGEVDFSGGSDAMTRCMMIVAYTVKFSGNTALQNDTTGCAANRTVRGKVLRLVA